MNAPDSIFTVQLGEAEVRVPREAAVMAYLEQEMDRRRPLPMLAVQAAQRIERAIETAAPAIGAEWQGAKYQGGIYAGPTVYENAPQRLVLLPGDVSNVGWDRAMAWAAEQGGTLPSRIDYLVLLANLRARFKEGYYWSCEQYASAAEYAWYQYFTYGGQAYWRKSSKYRACAVRRFPI